MEAAYEVIGPCPHCAETLREADVELGFVDCPDCGRSIDALLVEWRRSDSYLDEQP